MSVAAWLDAVVFLRTGSAACGGALVAEDRVLTAHHCVAGGGHPSVTWRDGARVVGHVVGVDHARDLAVIAIPAQPQRPRLAVADAPPDVGSGAWVLGHPLGSDVPEGFFAGTLRFSAAPTSVAAVGDRALQLTGTLEPGTSGGPVVDGEGHIVGVVSRRLGSVAFAARADGLNAHGDGWGRGPGAIVSAHLTGFDQPTADGLTAGGARVELAVHDRVWLAVGGYAPFAPLLAAERYGRSSSVVADAMVGLRQRVGRGPWSVDLDAIGALSAQQVWRRDGSGHPDSDTSPTWTFGGRVSARSVGFELTSALDGDVRAGVVLKWPGTLAVF